MKTLALIPARSGSKGIPNKNFRDFCGKPLWQWAYEVGAETCEMVCLSTDKPEECLTSRGFPVMLNRPERLAQDDTPMLSVVQHALEGNSFEVLVLLQPTQPLRQCKHILAALKLLEETGADSVVSVVEIPAHHSPDFAVYEEDGALKPIFGWTLDDLPIRRQDCTPAYARDGTVYAIRRQTIDDGSLYGHKCVPLIIPPGESVNIDTEDDWKRAEAMKGQAHA